MTKHRKRFGCWPLLPLLLLLLLATTALAIADPDPASDTTLAPQQITSVAATLTSTSAASAAMSTTLSARKKSSRKKQRGGRRKSPSPTELEGPPAGIDDPSFSCLIGDVCSQRGGPHTGYCHKPHKPINYQEEGDEAGDAESLLDMLLEHCPHFFDPDGQLLQPLCCTAEMEETMSRLIMSVDLIRRSCPSCLTNVKKLFCNLFCSANQRDFVRIERVKGRTVLEVSYAISALFAENFFLSCQDVRVFGAYLMDFEAACGPLKRANCTASDFMNVLGSLPDIPFNFRPLIVSEAMEHQLLAGAQRDSGHWPRYVMNDTAYQCHQAPPNQSACRCEHCPRICHASLTKQQHRRQPDLAPAAAAAGHRATALWSILWPVLLAVLLHTCTGPSPNI